MDASGFKQIFDSRGAFFRDSAHMSLSTMHSPCHKNIMITLVLNTTRIRIELEDMDPVRATSVLCLLGFGLGLGSLLVYRLYSRYINQQSRRRRHRTRNNSDNSATEVVPEDTVPSPAVPYKSNVESDQERPECSAAEDRCSSTMGNTLSDDASIASAYYYGDGVRFRGFHDEELNQNVQRGTPLDAENSLTASQRTESYEVIDSPASSSFTNLPDLVVNTDTRPSSLVSQDGSGLPPQLTHEGTTSPALSDLCGSYSDLSVRPNYSPDSLNERNFNLLQGEGEASDYNAGANVLLLDIKHPQSNENKDHRENKVEVVSDSEKDTVAEPEAMDHIRASRILESLSKESTPERVISPQIRKLRERWSFSSDESSNLDSASKRHYYSMSSDYESSPEHRNFSRRASSALSKIGSVTSDLDFSSGMDTPESEIFDIGDAAATVDYDQILEEVRGLHSELDDMSSKLIDLCLQDGSASDSENALSVNRKSSLKNTPEMKQVFKILRKHKSKHKVQLPRSLSLQDEREFSGGKSNSLRKGMSYADHRHSFGGNLNAVSPTCEDSIGADGSFITQDKTLDTANLASALADPEELNSRFREYVTRIHSELSVSFDQDFNSERNIPSSASNDSFHSCDSSQKCAEPHLSSEVRGSLEQDIVNDNLSLSSSSPRTKSSVFPHRLKDKHTSNKTACLEHSTDNHDNDSLGRNSSLIAENIELDNATSLLHEQLSVVLSSSPKMRNFNIDLRDCDNGNLERRDSIKSEDSGLDSRTSFTPESPLGNDNTTDSHSGAASVNVDIQMEDSNCKQDGPTVYSAGQTISRSGSRSDRWAVTVEEQKPGEHLSTGGSSVHNSIGSVEDICVYAEREWKGNTPKAHTIKKGYMDIPHLLNCRHLRRVRGDNYCALRATVYQSFVYSGELVSYPHIPHLQDALQILEDIQSSDYAFLHQWNFANRLPFTAESVHDTAIDCLKCYYGQRELVSRLPDYATRAKLITQVWNSKPTVDVKIMEAVKLLMMLTAIDYYKRNMNGKEVPMFVWLMYARDTSETPAQLLVNHINTVGDSGGLEQIEMFLLSYTLGICIEVARPSQHGQDDFITRYPSDVDHFPRVCLIAEDDRHYNVTVP